MAKTQKDVSQRCPCWCQDNKEVVMGAASFITQLPQLFFWEFGQSRFPSDVHRVDSNFFSPDKLDLPLEAVTHTEAHAIPPDAVTSPIGALAKQLESTGWWKQCYPWPRPPLQESHSVLISWWLDGAWHFLSKSLTFIFWLKTRQNLLVLIHKSFCNCTESCIAS